MSIWKDKLDDAPPLQKRRNRYVQQNKFTFPRPVISLHKKGSGR